MVSNEKYSNSLIRKRTLSSFSLCIPYGNVNDGRVSNSQLSENNESLFERQNFGVLLFRVRYCQDISLKCYYTQIKEYNKKRYQKL